MKKSKFFKKRLMAATLAVSLCASIFMGPATLEANAAGETVEVWLTNPNNGTWLKRQSDVSFGSNTGSANYTITVNEGTTYQTMDGFGASLTDSSCWLLYNKLSDSKRKEVLNNLFGPNGINISALRQPIGSSDFNWEAWTFCDTTNNVDDKNLNNFSLWREDAYIRPILDQAYNVNKGRIKIFATPWTPPAWMKTGKSLNGDTGGTLRTDCYDAYANYFVKYLQAYAQKGTPVYAITVQNEPLFASPWPGMKMSAQEQVNFINVLGPKLKSNGLNTKIIAYDHNYDNIDYAKTVFNGAGSYVSGSGFHYYSDINHGALTNLHNSYPNKDIYFTEGGSGTWIGGGTEKGMFQDLMMHIIRFPRNWAKSYIMWNVALNKNGGPVLTGSSSNNMGLLTIDSNTTDSVKYNCQYYGLGHSSKFVDPGAVRIESNTFEGQMENVAYKNPDGSKVVVLSNRQSSSKTVKIVWNNQAFTYTVPAEGAITFKWKNGSSSNSGSTTTSYPAATLADGQYYFKGANSGKIVCAANTGNDPLIANKDSYGGAWETLTVVNNSDGTISLKSGANSKYVCAVIDESCQLLARSASIGTWEKFNLVKVSDTAYGLKAVANGKYVCVNENSSNVLYATKDSISGWETFKIYKTNGTQVTPGSNSSSSSGSSSSSSNSGSSNSSGNSSSSGSTSSTVVADGQYYLADSQGKVVCAANAGNDPLIANKTACGGAWETLTIVNNSDGTVSFKSAANGKYVCAVIDESKQLLARSASIGTWEKFNLVRLSNGNFAIKAVANGKYVCADQNKSSVLYADRDSAGGWETFQIYKTNGTKVQ